MHNSRPPELYGAPIQIYHPAFTTFIRESLDTNANLTPEILKMAWELVSLSLEFYETKLERRAVLEKLGFWGSMTTTEFNLDKITVCPDGVLTAQPDGGHQTVVQVLELENEIGVGGRDPIMKAERSYASIVCSADVGVFPFSCWPSIKELCVVRSDLQGLMLSSVPCGDCRPTPGRVRGNLWGCSDDATANGLCLPWSLPKHQ